MRIRDLRGLAVAIWGYGREGRSALRVIRERLPDQALTVVGDGEPPAETRRELAALGVGFVDAAVWREASRSPLEGFDVLIRSPGVSIHRPEIRDARDVFVTSATRLWFAENPDAVAVGVTGTKGKSTTASLIASLLGGSGARVALGGNIGVPVLDLLDVDPRPDFWVLELSSFQTCDLDRGPTVGVLLNLLPEHLDWHGDVETYYRDKLNLLHRAGRAVVNAADPETLRRTEGLAERVLFEDERGFHSGADAIWSGSTRLLAPGEIGLRGRHNLHNVCAALTVLGCLGVDPRRALPDVKRFAPLPHRLEDLGVHAGLRFVNDSLATVPQSAMAAIAASTAPVSVLLGGRDRGLDYEALAHFLVDRGVFAAITMPESGPRIAATLREVARSRGSRTPRVVEAAGLCEAVTAAARITPPGGTVLLSPAAPSGRGFRDFQERGERFAACASALGEGGEACGAPATEACGPGTRNAGDRR